MGHSLECHQIQINKLKFIQQISTSSLDKIKATVVCLDILHIIHPCQLAQDFHSLSLSGHTGHSASGNHFLIQMEILLGIIIIANLVKVFHHKDICHSDNIAIKGMDSRAIMVCALRIGTAAHSLSINSHSHFFHHSINSFPLGGFLPHQQPKYTTSGASCQAFSGIFFDEFLFMTFE